MLPPDPPCIVRLIVSVSPRGLQCLHPRLWLQSLLSYPFLAFFSSPLVTCRSADSLNQMEGRTHRVGGIAPTYVYSVGPFPS